MNPQTLYAAPLSHFSRGDLELAGGKGANLGELVRARMPVPPGFVVTTAAYDRFVERAGLGEVISRALALLENDGASIRAAFEGASIPPEIEREVLSAYAELGQGAVAVRSSATAEDLPEAAFAGQQDTYLNIIGPQAVLDAVRRCWASLWTGRAIAYRQRQALDPAGIKLAVVVQRMVASQAAGVMFTANPLTGVRVETIVEASPGLGEAVVSGLVTPDHFILRRRGRAWHMIERRPGKREVIIRPLAGGGTEQINGTQQIDGAAPSAGAPSAAWSIPRRAVLRLAYLGARIQRHFGSPQDIEWAWAENQLFILQARPMTALPGAPAPLSLIQRMVANNFSEMLPVRPYPLDLDTWLPALESSVAPLFGLMGLEWRLDWLFEEEDGVVLRYLANLPRPTGCMLLAPARLLSLGLRFDPAGWQSDPLLAQSTARARALEARDPRTLTWEELPGLVRAAQQISALAGGEIRRRYFPRAAFAALRLRLLLMAVGETGRLGTLLSGAENKTLEMNHALEALAAQIRSDPELMRTFSEAPAEGLLAALESDPDGRAFLVQLNAFLDEYGHRETIISTALQPTWKDAPEMVLGVLKGFANYPPQAPKGAPAWQAARDAVLQHSLMQIAPLRSAFEGLVLEARRLLQIREDTHFYATLPLPFFHRALLEFGRRLVEAGVLDAPEDVFHLKLAELQAGATMTPELAAELRAAVERRKNARARLADTPLIDLRLPDPTAQAANAVLTGMAGSPGVAEGPARIVRDGSEFAKLVPGDVLVSPYTNPSWTPLFQRAVAVVVDSGSLASHAAIVAREYGIPAVMATVNGTRTLRDGERIRVDGSRGMVFRVTLSGQAGQNELNSESEAKSHE